MGLENHDKEFLFVLVSNAIAQYRPATSLMFPIFPYTSEPPFFPHYIPKPVVNALYFGKFPIKG